MSVSFHIEASDQNWDQVLIVDIEPILDKAPAHRVNFMVRLGVTDPNGENHIYQRTIYSVDTLTTNPLGILQIALDEMPEEAFRVEHPASSPNMARRQSGVVRPIQAGARKLRGHRPTLRRGQSEQHGSDE